MSILNPSLIIGNKILDAIVDFGMKKHIFFIGYWIAGSRRLNTARRQRLMLFRR